jgi:glyoxylase-like metal-dependent hydrolase (beta-lactamase superfamily II)
LRRERLIDLGKSGIDKMSTFKGVIEEFREIQVDYFRANGRRPLACFLSHIHSDHLAGLENPSFNAPLYVFLIERTFVD